MTNFEIEWGESRDVVTEIVALVEKNDGRFVGTKEELLGLLDIDSTPLRLIAKIRKSKDILREAHNIVYRADRKERVVVLEKKKRWNNADFDL